MKPWKLWLVAVIANLVIIATAVAPQADGQSRPGGVPRIEITEVPSYDCGGVEKSESIAGRVTGVEPQRYRLVIYSHACNGVLYVQPTVAAPFTNLDPDGAFDSYIHLGHTYYVLLVKAHAAFKPKPKMTEVPEKGGDIVAMAKVRGREKSSGLVGHGSRSRLSDGLIIKAARGDQNWVGTNYFSAHGVRVNHDGFHLSVRRLDSRRQSIHYAEVFADSKPFPNVVLTPPSPQLTLLSRADPARLAYPADSRRTK